MELTDPLLVFGEFYEEIQGRELSREEREFLEKVFDKVKGE